MRFLVLGLILIFHGLVLAQQPREMEFDALPCTAVGNITNDGRTCTEVDVKKYVDKGEKVLTREEKKIQKYSKKKDVLDQRRATQKRSRTNWPAGN